jgi:hypothetical protein
VKVDPKLGGQKNVPMLGGQWNVPSLVANGRRRRRRRFFCLVANGRGREKVLFHLFPLSPQATLLRPSFFFPLTLRFYFTMVLGRYLCISSLFLSL